MKNRVAFLVVAVGLLLIAAVSCSSNDAPTPTPEPDGTLSGTVTIGPLCPVEPCNNTSNPYSGLEAVLATINERVVATAPLSDEGTFSGGVPPGEYLLTIEPCEFLGCATELPIQVQVTSGAPTVVQIDIDTGIR